MNKLKLKFSAILLLIILVIVLSVLAVYRLGNEAKASNCLDNYAKAIIKINDTYPTDVIVYGESINFRKSFDYRVVNDLSGNSLNSSNSYKHKFIVISDMYSSLTLSDEDITNMKNYIDNYGYNFFYIGTHYITKFHDCGYFESIDNEAEGFGLLYIKGDLTMTVGFWMKDDTEKFGEVGDAIAEGLLFTMERVYD